MYLVDKAHTFRWFQVRNAQHAGASAVIIADDTCRCSDKACVRPVEDVCEPSEPIMADDGSGSDISIPSFLMFKPDADKVKEQLKDDHPVQMEMAWSLPSQGCVEYELWTSPFHRFSNNLLTYDFMKMARGLGDRAYFTPHMYIANGEASGCRGVDGENRCANLCTNNGRYCAAADENLERGITGAYVVEESLRWLCIWKHYGEKDGIGLPWWDYVDIFTLACADLPNIKDVKDCARNAYMVVSITVDIIDRCMSDSGGLVGDVSNSLLDLEIKTREQRGVLILPSAFVNTAPIRGELSVENIFHAICAGYALGTAPPICAQCTGCMDTAQCAELGGVCIKRYGGGLTPQGTVSHGTFTTTILLMIACLGGGGYWYYNKTRREMRDHVRGILAEYMPLDDDDGGMRNPMSFAVEPSTQAFMSS